MKTWLLVLVMVVLLAGQVACRPSSSSPLEQAAAEATALVAQAEATALILHAQAEATAMILSAVSHPATATPLPAEPPATSSPQQASTLPATPDSEQPPPIPEVIQGTPLADGQVEIMSVEYAGEGGFIMVNYRASYQTAQNFWPGRVSVIDEATGTVYSEVATMPIIGPLIARPAREGQEGGYIMFVNNPPLARGSKITVVLDSYREEHLVIP